MAFILPEFFVCFLLALFSIAADIKHAQQFVTQLSENVVYCSLISCTRRTAQPFSV